MWSCENCGSNTRRVDSEKCVDICTNCGARDTVSPIARRLRLRESNRALISARVTRDFEGLLHLLVRMPETAETRNAKLRLLDAFQAFEAAVKGADFPEVF